MLCFILSPISCVLLSTTLLLLKEFYSSLSDVRTVDTNFISVVLQMSLHFVTKLWLGKLFVSLLIVLS